MITFRITLLIGINLQLEDKKRSKSVKKRKGNKGRTSKREKRSSKTKSKSVKGSKKKSSKRSSKKRSKSDKKSRKGRKSTKSSETAREIPKFVQEDNIWVLNVKSPLKSFHIDYDLYPKHFKYTCDVHCWGPVAKIYSVDSTKCLKTVTKKDITYIPIHIEHYMKELDDDEVTRLLGHVITFSIKVGKQKLGRLAKADKCKAFYVLDSDYETDDFIEVLTEKPEICYNVDSKSSLKQEIRAMLEKWILYPTSSEVVSAVRFVDDVHRVHIQEIIFKRTSGERIRCKDNHVTVKEKVSKKSKKKKKKRKTKESGKKETGVKIAVPAEVLFTDPTLSTFESKEENELFKAYVLLSSENLLTNRQKFHFNPMIVKLWKINNLPFELLRKNNISNIFLRCNIPKISEFKTLPKEISRTVFFDEARFIRTDHVTKLDLLTLFQASCVTVELFGLKDKPSEETGGKGKQKKPKGKKQKKRKGGSKKSSSKKSSKSSSTTSGSTGTKKGSKKSKSSRGSKSSKKSAKSSNVEVEIVALGTTTLDMSSLGKHFWIFKEKAQIHNRDRFNKFGNRLSTYFIDRITVNELNLTGCKTPPQHSSILPESILLECNTTVKVEAHFETPQHPAYYISDMNSTYQRLLVVMVDRSLAKDFLDEIISQNFKSTRFGMFPSSLDPQKLNDILVTNFPPLDADESQQRLITGFLIDDADNFVFFVEGQSNGAILHLVHYVATFAYDRARVFYNSKYMFGERLYGAFLNFYGFFAVTLKMTLRNILARRDVYVRGNVPMPCFLALQKIDLMMASDTFKVILNQDLLPSELELMSFAIEYGLNLEYKTVQTNKPTIVTSDVITSNASNKALFGSDYQYS